MTTIVIVDDHALFRAHARAMLELDGFAVVGEAGDGSTGVDVARRLQPEVILLDIGLPDIDGLAVVDQMVALESRPTVVLMSSRPADTYGARIADSYAAGFVPKEDVSGPAVRALLP